MLSIRMIKSLQGAGSAGAAGHDDLLPGVDHLSDGFYLPGDITGDSPLIHE
jgi:hypothetical protein